MPRVAVRVMHVPADIDRRRYVAALRRVLGSEEAEAAGVDFGVVEDNVGRGPWDTAQKCWLSGLRSGADRVLVVQDDAELCRGFLGALSRIAEARPVDVLMFFVSSSYLNSAVAKGERWAQFNWAYGLALSAPAQVVREFILWNDANFDPRFVHDDTRMTLFCRATGRKLLAPVPSLVQHAGVKDSLLGHAPLCFAKHFYDGDDAGAVLWEDVGTPRSVTNYPTKDLVRSYAYALRKGGPLLTRAFAEGWMTADDFKWLGAETRWKANLKQRWKEGGRG